MPKYKLTSQLSRSGKKRRILLYKRRESFTPCLDSRPVSPQLINISPSTSASSEISQIAAIAEQFSPLNGNDEKIYSEFSIEGPSGCEIEDVNKFEMELRAWAVQCRIPHKHLNQLLNVLRKNGHSNLPKDARSLLKTKKFIDIIEVDPGEYHHVGVETNLLNILRYVENIPTEINLDFNIDGVDILKSSTKSFWFIQGRIFGFEVYKKPFVVGIYYGRKKPKDFNQFLRPFVDEMKILTENFKFGEKSIKVIIRCFICDAPARNYCTGTKGFNGYFGCGKCTVEGDYINHRQVFPDLDCPLRMDFVNDEDHNLKHSILSELNIGFVTQFPLDYLHCVLLGVVKKFIFMLLNGDLNVKLPSIQIQKISEHLEELELSQPFDFQRRIKSFEYLHLWKGNEYRTFLLYTGPVILKNILDSEKYSHFLQLHVAIIILCDPNLYLSQTNLAKKLLRDYVESFSEIYGQHHIVYNIHSLIHLTDDIYKLGTLDDHSSFMFESYNYQISQLLRKSNQPIQQLGKRIYEEMQVNTAAQLKNHITYPTFYKKDRNADKFYAVKLRSNLTLNSSRKNCWFLTKKDEIGKFLHVKKENSQYWIVADAVKNLKDFYTFPISSSYLSIFSALKISRRERITVTMDEIVSKVFCMEINDEIVFSPLRHNFK